MYAVRNWDRSEAVLDSHPIRIYDLQQKLGFVDEHHGKWRSFTEELRKVREDYVSSDGRYGWTLQAPGDQESMREIVDKFLDDLLNGNRFWPDVEWDPYYNEELVYSHPRHHQYVWMWSFARRWDPNLEQNHTRPCTRDFQLPEHLSS